MRDSTRATLITQPMIARLCYKCINVIRRHCSPMEVPQPPEGSSSNVPKLSIGSACKDTPDSEARSNRMEPDQIGAVTIATSKELTFVVLICKPLVANRGIRARMPLSTDSGSTPIFPSSRYHSLRGEMSSVIMFWIVKLRGPSGSP
ncbi:hypothetical protein EVAR_97095_1 [Eumeta japonica]|uniref:Uncharacterized protein n=1 Tax=Eumeta variegata TaxID=151549 RepID=A0A4C1X733_EUMVA|nr:hypothetical protein EVAR_97095_1 [Eumeta japonica]